MTVLKQDLSNADELKKYKDLLDKLLLSILVKIRIVKSGESFLFNCCIMLISTKKDLLSC